ncbi:MAG: class I SAM-dependent methyltransferase [Planctomycetota bacterium]
MNQSDKNVAHTFGVTDYEAYWKSRPLDEAVRERQREFAFLTRLLPPPNRILELGPGGGQLFWASQKAGYEMFAVDISQTVIDHLGANPERARKADLNEGLPDFGARFGGIVGVMVLHHIARPGVLLEQLRDVLEPGGYLLLTVPNIIILKNRLRLLVGKFPRLSPSHRNFMTPHEIRKLLEKTGFQTLKITSSRNKFLNRLAPILFSRELIIVARVSA